MKNRLSKFIDKHFTAIVWCFVAALALAYPIAYYSSSEIITITVSEKERVVELHKEGSASKYLVFCKSEVFENTDSWVYMKFNSSDVYSKLKPGQTYKVKVAGWRINFFSWYRNIISVETEEV